MKNGCKAVSPQSGSELPFDPNDINKNPYQKDSHNCYAYMLGVKDLARIQRCQKNKDCGFPVPGKKTGHPELTGTLGKTCDDVVARTMADVPGSYLTTFSEQCKPGFYKGFILVDKDSDFHYGRQDKCPEKSQTCVPGQWSDKAGATNVDRKAPDGSLMMTPHKIVWDKPPRFKGDSGLYYEFCNYLCIPNKQHTIAGGKRRLRTQKKRQN